MDYESFVRSKLHESNMHGFDPVFVPDCLMPFQADLVRWATRKGRCAIFADCGLGKSLMQLVWAENVARKTGGRILILSPLAVGAQTVREAEKFGIEAARSRDGSLPAQLIVTNYERLHLFNPTDFVGCVCDESSILKNYDGATKAAITEFMRKMSYRLLCTATAAPNDYIELGTSSEALGELGFMDMLGRFFKNDTNPTSDTRRKYAQTGGEVPKWRFKWHAEMPFWQWVCSWARAVRKPSDLGFNNGPFQLPTLIEREHIVAPCRPRDGMLFDLPSKGLWEQREERRRTIDERCGMASDLAKLHDSSILWCYLNDEGDLLEKLVPDAVQVCGSQSDDEKEEKLMAFLSGEAKRLITKPMCAGFGLNLQHCAHMTFFPSHSYEQYYQSVRRCWRFGQKRPVTVDVVASKGESAVMANLQRKATAADQMFERLVTSMNNALQISTSRTFNTKTEAPSWL
ncbi:MAG: helicase [Planctomycetes bacterium]|nr:helicase [Planctomycetota bacterium]